MAGKIRLRLAGSTRLPGTKRTRVRLVPMDFPRQPGRRRFRMSPFTEKPKVKDTRSNKEKRQFRRKFA